MPRNTTPNQTRLLLYDPREGDAALQVADVHLSRGIHEPARTNYFAVYWIRNGSGRFWADAASFRFGPDKLLFFKPYQHVRFEATRATRGALIQFHANFLCVETFHAEVGCSGVLFNDPYGIPVVVAGRTRRIERSSRLIEQFGRNKPSAIWPSARLMLAYLKVLLILATRLKSRRDSACRPGDGPRHPALAELRDLIEQNYRTSALARRLRQALHMTPEDARPDRPRTTGQDAHRSDPRTAS